MKRTNLIMAVVAAGALMTSCAGETKTEEGAATAEETVEAEPVTEVMAWTVDTENSNIRWEGGVTGGQVYSHFGSIKIQSGKIMTEGEGINAAEIVVDMNTITPEDEGYSEEHPASDLVGHLATADFFDIENNPTAMFQFTRMEEGAAYGNLSIRGKENEEKLVIDSMEMMEDGNMHIVGHIDFDRQKYDVAWAHYMEDVLLSDNINLQFDIIGVKS